MIRDDRQDDKQRIDHTAHPDQLLPVPTVPGKARDFAGRQDWIEELQ